MLSAAATSTAKPFYENLDEALTFAPQGDDKVFHASYSVNIAADIRRGLGGECGTEHLEV